MAALAIIGLSSRPKTDRGPRRTGTPTVVHEWEEGSWRILRIVARLNAPGATIPRSLPFTSLMARSRSLCPLPAHRGLPTWARAKSGLLSVAGHCYNAALALQLSHGLGLFIGRTSASTYRFPTLTPPRRGRAVSAREHNNANPIVP